MSRAAEWRIGSIRKAHRRDDFDCGHPELDDFLKRYARQNEKLGVGRTYVATREGKTDVLGYYTIANGSAEARNLPENEAKKFPNYPPPTVHIGRLARDRTVQGEGLGPILLMHALENAWKVSQMIGVAAVDVIAKDEEGRTFYENHEFQEFTDDRLHLYLPISVVRDLFGRK